ncbi:helicase-related protein, partial [Psychrobacter sp. I-STPA6b]
ATMTQDVEALIDDFFIAPKKIFIAVSGTPLDNIKQISYDVPNFYTKVNLLHELISNKTEYSKVLIFAPNKRNADRLYDCVKEEFPAQSCVIHSNKTQNYRLRSIEQFNKGEKRILIATDVIARGLDLAEVTHVINFNTPYFPENYMHRIGRTGRAEHEGTA